MARIVRDQRIGSAIDRRLQNHLVIRVPKLRPPLEADLDRLAPAGENGKKSVDVSQSQTVREPLLWTLEHSLIVLPFWLA